MDLPKDSEARKHVPIASGVLDYFPDAFAAIAEVSYLGNEKHNKGKPLHWSRENSSDHADCLIRHFLQRGETDTLMDQPVRHTAEMAWRALAILQLEIEASKREGEHSMAHTPVIATPPGSPPREPYDHCCRQ